MRPTDRDRDLSRPKVGDFAHLLRQTTYRASNDRPKTSQVNHQSGNNIIYNRNRLSASLRGSGGEGGGGG